MRKFAFIIILLTTLFNVEIDALNTNIVPQPLNMEVGDGQFIFTDETKFGVENSMQERIVANFIEQLNRVSGIQPKVTRKHKKAHVKLRTNKTLKSEAYSLDVTPATVVIEAADDKGFYYAMQTIRLLLPAQIESAALVQCTWAIPAVKIQDEPRFGYRGLMLDASRFFIPKENVLRIIDCMAMLKLNKLHFHLIDDNGWRIEIKKYPKLTEVGAWRVDRGDLPFPARPNPTADEPTPIGGFYTQDDIREIVAYADQRHIEVIPEIEMPAHTNSSLAAYPNLACPVVNRFIGVLPGGGGSHADIIYCAGNEEVFSFLEDVINEVIELFPSKYIHLGGDEAWKSNWKKCPLCQQRIKEEGLNCEEELQGYFMQRMARYVRQQGKEVMGWDELTNSKLPEDVIIFGWQGYGNAALKAAEQGHRFVMTPARIMYLIRYQGPQWFEPVTYFGNNTLKDVYDYEPIQANWKPQYADLLMGVQASLWTEFCNSAEDVDYLVFPRLAALAEVAWSPKDSKDWASFLKGLDKYNEHIALKGVGYAKSMFNIQHTITPSNNQVNVVLECIRPDVTIHYTLDNSEPTANSPVYNNILSFDQAGVLKCATFASDNKQVGQTLVLPINWNLATGKTIISGNTATKVLTNGIRGSLKQSDFEWCSWEKSDSVSFVVDLEKEQPIQSFTIGSVTNYGMSVHKPASIVVEASNDNINYHKIGTAQYEDAQIFVPGNYIDDCEIEIAPSSARYLRITAKGPGKSPQSHVRAGQESRVMFDEIIIN